MSDAPSHTAFFGDGEKTFALPPEMIMELERKTGRGIGGLCRSIFAGDFRHQELTETIRLSLIGGGESPKDAAALVATYAAPLPVMRLYELVLPIMDTVMFGQAAKTSKKRGRK